MRTKNLLLLTALGCLGFGLASQARAASSILNNLALHLPFDNDYNDSSGNGINGTPQGSPKFVTGQIGSAVSVTTLKDGSEIDFVSLGAPPSLQFGSDISFSISMWCNYTNSVDDPPLISNKDWSSSGNTGWGIFTQADGAFRVNATGDAGGTKQDMHPAKVIRDGKWHHLVVTFDRKGQAVAYVDGAQVGSSDMSASKGSLDTLLSINVGQDGTGSYTDGGNAEMVNVQIDDLGIWKRILTAPEISAIYAGGLKGQSLSQVNVALPPAITALAPLPDSTGAAGNAQISATIQDADTSVDPNSVQLTIDTTTVTPTLSKAGNVTTVLYAPTNVFAPNTTHAIKLAFKDNASPANQISTNWSFTVLNYAALPASAAQPAGAVDTSSAGFVMRIHQIDSSSVGHLPGTVAHAEAQLAGVLIDPATSAPYANIASAGTNPDGSYSLTKVLNFSFDPSTDQGAFTSANGFPEDPIPGGAGDADNLAAEILTYLQLPAGYYRFGVNSSDGFRVTAGPDARDAFSTQLGTFDTRRITGETTFDVSVAQTGFYSIRIVWFRQGDMPNNGSSKGSFEFYTIAPDGSKALVNDTANPKAVKAYQKSSAATGPYVKYAGPTSFISDYRGSDFGLPSVQVKIADGATAKLDPSSVKLSVDATAVQPTTATASGVTTLTYTPTGLQLPRTVHTGSLSFATQGSTTPITATWQFNGLRNYVLPGAPLFSENFDSTAEGSFPTGWVEENHTGHQTAGLDPTDLNSDFYLGWVVIGDDIAPNKVNGFAPGQVLNGKTFDDNNPLMSGHFLYAESDARQNGPPGQIQYLTTPTYDLTGKTGIVIAFNSSFEQNQDSLNALEYSADGGTNWNPVFYWVQGDSDTQGPPDILRDASGMVDAVATMTTSYSDVARYTDAGGALVGGTFGFFIKAPVTQALAPYIEGRINDDGSESKRVELFRVPLADNQSKVSFRFVQAGTSSWYWGVDNWAIYSDPSQVIQPPADIKFTRVAKNSDGTITVEWTGGGTLEASPTMTPGSWQAASTTSPYTFKPTTPYLFGRIKK